MQIITHSLENVMLKAHYNHHNIHDVAYFYSTTNIITTYFFVLYFIFLFKQNIILPYTVMVRIIGTRGKYDQRRL